MILETKNNKNKIMYLMTGVLVSIGFSATSAKAEWFDLARLANVRHDTQGSLVHLPDLSSHNVTVNPSSGLVTLAGSPPLSHYRLNTRLSFRWANGLTIRVDQRKCDYRLLTSFRAQQFGTGSNVSGPFQFTNLVVTPSYSTLGLNLGYFPLFNSNFPENLQGRAYVSTLNLGIPLSESDLVTMVVSGLNIGQSGGSLNFDLIVKSSGIYAPHFQRFTSGVIQSTCSLTTHQGFGTPAEPAKIESSQTSPLESSQIVAPTTLKTTK